MTTPDIRAHIKLPFPDESRKHDNVFVASMESENTSKKFTSHFLNINLKPTLHNLPSTKPLEYECLPVALSSN